MRYLAALVALGLLIAFHELGHLLVARLLRIRVTRFSLGFGPPIVTFQGRRTEWRISALPLGGYVVVHGMNPHDAAADPNDRSSYSSRPPWQRLLVLGAGSAFNALLAIVVLVALFAAGTHVPVPRTIGVVEPGSAAARALLRPGDAVHAIDGRPLGEWRELVEAVLDSPGRPLTLEILRDGERFTAEVTPRADADGVGRLGISQQYVYREHTVGEAIPLAFGYTARLLREGGALLWRLLRGKPGVELASPVLIVKQASDAASLGWDTFLRVLVHLSVALALFNLLPFPALDGGRMLFVAVQAVSGRKIPARVETLAHGVGFLLLIALVLWVALKDVRGLWRQDDERPGPEPGALEDAGSSDDADGG